MGRTQANAWIEVQLWNKPNNGFEGEARTADIVATWMKQVARNLTFIEINQDLDTVSWAAFQHER